MADGSGPEISVADFNSEEMGNWISGEGVVSFFIMLKHPMMLPHGHQLTRYLCGPWIPWLGETGANAYTTLTFWRASEVLDLRLDTYVVASAVSHFVQQGGTPGSFNGIAADEELLLQHTSKGDQLVQRVGTVVEIQLPLSSKANHEWDFPIHQAFDLGLLVLAELSTAYLLLSDDITFRPISRPTLPFIVPFLVTDSSGERSPVSRYVVHSGVSTIPSSPEELGDHQIEDLMKIVLRVHLNDPFALAARVARSARKAVDIDGDYAAAVVQSFTSLEILFNALILCCAWEEKVKRSVTRTWFSTANGPHFMQRVEQHVPHKLKGKWGSRGTESPLGDLYQLSDLRNQVVHNGYQPTEYEARRSVASCSRITEFAKIQVAERRFQFPRTAILFVGSGLNRLGKVSNKMRRILEEIEGEDSWLHAFLLWRDTPDTTTSPSDNASPQVRRLHPFRISLRARLAKLLSRSMTLVNRIFRH